MGIQQPINRDSRFTMKHPRNRLYRQAVNWLATGSVAWDAGVATRGTAAVFSRPWCPGHSERLFAECSVRR